MRYIAIFQETKGIAVGGSEQTRQVLLAGLLFTADLLCLPWHSHMERSASTAMSIMSCHPGPDYKRTAGAEL